jgi:hypothetical protein
MLGLFFPAHDTVIAVNGCYAEAGGMLRIDLDRSDGDVSVMLTVPLDHIEVIHFVDVIACQNQRKLWFFGEDALAILEDCVGSTQIPAIVDPLHGRDHFDVLT